MPIKLVVFDLAGTTVSDSGNSVSNAFCSAFLNFGYTVPPHELLAVKGFEKRMAVKTILEQYEHDATKITGELVKKIHDVFVQHMVTHFSQDEGAIALPGVEATFAALHGMGIRVCLNTGFSKGLADMIVKRLGWAEKGLIDHVIAGDEVELGRPAPFMINGLMQLYGITDAKHVVKIGDTPADIQEGKNADCLYSIGITTGAFSQEQLAKCQPDYIIDNMNQLIPIIIGHFD